MPQPTPTPTPTPITDLICGNFKLAFAPPGSPDWCRTQDDILASFKKLGITILDWAEGKLQSVEAWADTLNNIQIGDCGITNLFQCISNGVQKAAGWLVSNAAHGLRYALCMLRSGVIAGNSCDPITYSSIMAVKMAWYYVKNADIGSEVWILVVSKLGDARIALIDDMLDYLLNIVCPMDAPTIPDAMEAFLNNEIDRPTYECWLRLNGMLPSTYEPVLSARREKLTTAEIIQWSRRKFNASDKVASVPDPNNPGQTIAVTPADKAAYDLMRNLGWLDASEILARILLYDEIPTVSDHMHWLQRNVFDRQYVSDYELDGGFEEKFWPVFGKDLLAQGMKKEYARYHYEAHWLNPSPEQLKEMVYRLRPDKAGVTNPFTSEDYVKILTEQDVGPYFRRRFDEIKYHIPALGYIRDMYRQYIITDDELVSYHQDLGYSEQDSTHFLAVDKIQRARMRASQGHGWTPAALAAAYSIERITSKDVDDGMLALGYTIEESIQLKKRAKSELHRSVFMRAKSRALTSIVTEIRNAIRIGIMSMDQARQTLLDAGWPESYASSLVSSESASAGVARIKEIISAVRKAYLRGEVDRSGANGILQQSGLQVDAIQGYLSLWDLQQTPTRRRRTASQISASVVSGDLSADEAYIQLHNLGYDDADTRLFLADVQHKIDSNAAKSTQLRIKEDKQSALELQRLHDRSLKQSAQILEAMRRQAPPAKLEKWLALGIISPAFYTLRMKLYGYDPQWIAMNIEEVAAKAAKSDKTAAKQAAAVKHMMMLNEPPSELKKWLKLGLIGEDLFRQQMESYGYLPPALDLIVKEIADEKGANIVPREATIQAGS